jgi:hypothetical protein
MTYTMDKVASAYKAAMEKEAIITPAPFISGIGKAMPRYAGAARTAVAKVEPLSGLAEKAYLHGVPATHNPVAAVANRVAAPAAATTATAAPAAVNKVRLLTPAEAAARKAGQAAQV